jgi:hypothetical protein
MNSDDGQYRCSGINADHLCEPDPKTWDRYPQHRTKNPIIQQHGVLMLSTGIRPGQAAACLNLQLNSRVRSGDLSRIDQTYKKNLRSLSECGLELSECQRLLQAITNNGDQYRVKFRGATQVMDSIFYWDPTEAQLARRFSQVFNLLIIADLRSFNSIRLLKIMLGDIHYSRSRLQRMR